VRAATSQIAESLASGEGHHPRDRSTSPTALHSSTDRRFNLTGWRTFAPAIVEDALGVNADTSGFDNARAQRRQPVRVEPSIVLLWSAVGLVGAIAWGVGPSPRRANLAIWLVAAALGSYAIAYRFYAASSASECSGSMTAGHTGPSG